MTRRGSQNARRANENGIPCLRRLTLSLSGSHSKVVFGIVRLYSIEIITYSYAYFNAYSAMHIQQRPREWPGSWSIVDGQWSMVFKYLICNYFNANGLAKASAIFLSPKR